MENHAAGAVLTDQECVRDLRSLAPQQHESVVIKQLLTGRAPSELPPFFVAAGPPLVSPIVTPHGSWNVRNVKKHMAIRASGGVESRPRYVGVKTILEFVPKSVGKNSKHAGKKRGLDLDDTMADCWIMIQYHNLREEGLAEDIKFVIEEETSLCRVLHIGEILQDIKRRLNISDSQEQMACHSEGGCSLMELDIYSDFENALNGSEDPSRRKLETSQAEENAMKLFEDLYSQYRLSSACEEELAPSESGDDAPPARSPAGRKSEVWNYFSRIQQKQEDDIDLQFAACHECGEMLKADPKKDGTKSLWRHRDAHLNTNAQSGQKKKSSSTTPRTFLP